MRGRVANWMRQTARVAASLATLAAAVSLLASAPAASAANVVLDGDDFLVTISESTNWEITVPAGFFDTGSDAFSEVVEFEGVPIDPGTFGDVDTVVRRLDDANVTTIVSSDTVDIEIIALRMKSIDPITVTYGGGSPELWDVDVCLRNVTQDTGTMLITRQSEFGGVAEPELPVKVVLTFSRLPPDSALQQTLDVDDTLAPADPVPWLEDSSPFGISVSSGTMIDTDCDDVADTASTGTSNFELGVFLANTSVNDPDLSCQAVFPNIEDGGTNPGSHSVSLPQNPGFPFSCCLKAGGSLTGKCEPLGEGPGKTRTDDCKNNHQVVGGEGADCTTPGACCLPGGCITGSNKCCCEMAGGVFAGEGSTTCPPPCVDSGVPALSGRGLVALGLALLAATFFALRRRGMKPHVRLGTVLVLAAALVAVGVSYAAIRNGADGRCTARAATPSAELSGDLCTSE